MNRIDLEARVALIGGGGNAGRVVNLASDQGAVSMN
jgi:hypothetical protein